MGITDFFMKMNMATGGRDPNAALVDGLRSVGLSPVRQDGAVSEYGGWFGQRQAGMSVDGSALMHASSGAHAKAAGLGVASALGMVSSGYSDWASRNNDYRARSAMQNAQMVLRWWLSCQRPLAGNATIRRDPVQGFHPLAPGLYAYMDGALWGAVTQPHQVQALLAAPFHVIEASGHNLVATWTPPMSEYQGIAASPEAFARASHAALCALSGVADAAGG